MVGELAFGNRHATMTRDLLYREGVCPSFAEPRQKNVAQRVYHAVFWKLQICSKLFVKMVERSDQVGFAKGIGKYIFRFALQRSIHHQILRA